MNGDKYRTLKFKKKDLTFYTFIMSSKKLRKIAYALPKSRDNPDKIQRALNLSRIEEIGNFIRGDTRGVFPNNIILNLKSDVEFYEDPNNPAEGVLVFPIATKEKNSCTYSMDNIDCLVLKRPKELNLTYPL